MPMQGWPDPALRTAFLTWMAWLASKIISEAVDGHNARLQRKKPRPCWQGPVVCTSRPVVRPQTQQPPRAACGPATELQTTTRYSKASKHQKPPGLVIAGVLMPTIL